MSSATTRILCIETSGRRGSAAIAVGPRLIEERGFATDAEHARDLLPIIDHLCRAHGWSPRDIEHCYLSIGPGSFTGLRVAVTFARHLALATDCRICAVPTLDVIAQNALELSGPPPLVAPILDARRRQVFTAAYEWRDRYEATGEPRMTAPEAFLAPLRERGVVVLGEGVAWHRAAIEAAGASVAPEALWWPRSAGVHALGWRMAQEDRFVDSVRLTPLYVRRPEAEELWERRQAGHSTGARET